MYVGNFNEENLKECIIYICKGKLIWYKSQITQLKTTFKNKYYNTGLLVMFFLRSLVPLAENLGNTSKGLFGRYGFKLQYYKTVVL